MKLVLAIIRPEKLTDVMNALEAAGIKSLTVTNVRGRGTQKGITQQWRGKEYSVDLLEKIQVKVVVTDDLVNDTIEAILTSAATGQIGDGKVFVLPVETAIRIRTRTTGEKAI